jgi:16S rRNA C1402 N4-methylase RsmH
MKHTTVLLNEAIDGLDIHNGEIFVDGTLGGGGHTEEVIKRFGNQIKIIGIDADSDAIKRSKKRIDSLGIKANIDFVKNNFRNMDKVLEGVKIENVDKILLDIGLSSNQFEDSGRGFSFQRDEPLIMSFKKDIDSDIVKNKIQASRDEGIKIGINGTPTFFVNGKAISNPQGYEQFKTIIEEAIKNSTK